MGQDLAYFSSGVRVYIRKIRTAANATGAGRMNCVRILCSLIQLRLVADKFSSLKTKNPLNTSVENSDCSSRGSGSALTNRWLAVWWLVVSASTNRWLTSILHWPIVAYTDCSSRGSGGNGSAQVFVHPRHRWLLVFHVTQSKTFVENMTAIRIAVRVGQCRNAISQRRNAISDGWLLVLPLGPVVNIHWKRDNNQDCSSRGSRRKGWLVGWQALNGRIFRWLCVD